jgi:hypothetical protein
LRPAPVVARVSSGLPGIPTELVARELAVVQHVAPAGVAVIPPSDLLDPGPHEYGGHVIAFWRYVETTGELDAAAAGAALGAIHEALADYDGDLPRGERADETRELLADWRHSADRDLLCELAAGPLPDGQAIHGDAHLGNCLPGPLWHDFETACRGPRELDLAALILRDRWAEPDPARGAALAAYGEHDRDLLEASLPVYGAWICASYASAADRRPELLERVEAMLVWLRRYRNGV